MFTLSDEVHIVLRGSSAETHFELYYECIVDENDGLKLSALWLSLWLTMLFLMVFVCCALGFWMMRHRRRRLEDLRDAHSIMIHGELVRMRSQANRRAALEEVTAQEVGDVAALEAIPVRTASECELTEVNGGAASSLLGSIGFNWDSWTESSGLRGSAQDQALNLCNGLPCVGDGAIFWMDPAAATPGWTSPARGGLPGNAGGAGKVWNW